jgi:hypothetical protein
MTYWTNIVPCVIYYVYKMSYTVKIYCLSCVKKVLMKRFKDYTKHCGFLMAVCYVWLLGFWTLCIEWSSQSSGLWEQLVLWWYDIYLLTAIGLSPGGSSTVHIYTQTVHRMTQKKIETVRAVPRLGELYPGICLTTAERARKNLSQGIWTIRIHIDKNRT